MRYLHPIDGKYNPDVKFTYIWHVLESSDGNMYFIEHEHGEAPEFYLTNEMAKMVLGNVDLSRLKSHKRYVIATENYLTPYQENPAPVSTPVSEPKINPHSNVEVNQQPKDIHTTPIAQSTEKQLTHNVPEGSPEISPAKEPTSSVKTTSAPIMSSHEGAPTVNIQVPHFTIRDIPIQTMVEHVALPIKTVVHKMPEPFTIEAPSGEKKQGRGGDYIVFIEGVGLSVEPKETFQHKYTPLGDITPIQLGDKGEFYALPPSVKQYIEDLQGLNIELRDKLYLDDNLEKE